ncbi:hypothetical protein CEXT_293031 [Caerostris extrusa]|uniref:Uncharacterized protein n=1 Tax=Caerostris extrusa TaxID=172846 RepID=A0AAV4WLV3_CAEEX|nr:hypothetical protein CEXT_293031 [Caerostris extrusa]
MNQHYGRGPNEGCVKRNSFKHNTTWSKLKQQTCSQQRLNAIYQPAGPYAGTETDSQINKTTVRKRGTKILIGVEQTLG